MKAFRIGGSLAEQAVTRARFEILGKVGTDLSTIGSWDPKLSRRTRILVPVDVQAYVVPPGGSEVTVPLRGAADDPAPFAEGASKPAGVHLHWAMPDALLAGGHDPSSSSLSLPRLPDTWVVVRTLAPRGKDHVVVTGWVVHAPSGAVTALETFTGTPGTPPTGMPLLEPLDGASGGPVWTASYAASAGRFALHDPLTDLGGLAEVAPTGFEDDQAGYTVAGWWSSLSEDPLAVARGAASLDSVLARLGWRVDHEEDDEALDTPDPRVRRLLDQLGLDSESPVPKTRVVRHDGGVISGAQDGVSFATAYPVREVDAVWFGEALPTYASLLHGSVLGVPVAGDLPPVDDRPVPEALSVALGTDLDDVVAAFGASGLETDPDHRAAAENLVAAFSAGLVTTLGTTDGLDDLGDREHANGFWSLIGAPLPAARSDRLRTEDTLAASPVTVGRKGRAAARDATKEAPEGATLRWKRTLTVKDEPGPRAEQHTRIEETGPAGGQLPESRQVARPAPRYYRPQPKLLAVRGARPNHRHHGDGLYDDSGRLLCRYPASAVDRLDGVVDGATVVPTLGSGAVPAEVLTVVRESVLLNPYVADWLAAAGAPPSSLEEPYRRRVQAEMTRLYGSDGVYDGSSHIAFTTAKARTTSSWDGVRASEHAMDLRVAAEMARFSVVRGTTPSPVALTTWRQPWVPLWVEWQVTLTGSDSLRGWSLDGLDLETDEAEEPGGNPVTTTLVGRSLLGQGVGETLRQAVKSWLASEHRRQATPGNTAYADPAVLRELADLDRPLDLVSASLDGVGEQLLGIDYVSQILRGPDGRPRAVGAPTVLFGGTLRLDALRVVDAFGRTLDATDETLDSLRSTVELEDPTDPRAIRMRPRVQGSARWLWRLVDPRQPAGTPAEALQEAYVDQIEPAEAVNPVAGFLLPDHVDESLETFTVTGRAIGEVGHDAVSLAVTWDPAPGRPVPPDAGPLVDLAAQERIVGEIAAGMVRADAAARGSATPPESSALVSFLRAVDTTLWTVDTFASLGSGTIAGLVGRPIAVVRASLRLEVPDDLGEVTVTATGSPEARRRAFEALAAEELEVKLGTLTRTDDALLGYFVDDDYEHCHLVDKVLAAHAKETGRHVGQLGLLGEALAPGETALDHPYLVAAGGLRMRPGQTVMLTLLMLPGGRVHLTSGILPRKELELADSWVTPGLKRLVPSVRVGPLLVDPEEIRLPLVSLLGDKQTFTRRTGELTWRDDPILAATQTAYLPRLPHEVQEGWVRVTPDPDDPTVATGGA